jgi:hypothetical protein
MSIFQGCNCLLFTMLRLFGTRESISPRLKQSLQLSVTLICNLLFFNELFFGKPKWLSSLRKFNQSAYRPDMKYKSLIIYSYFSVHTENHIWESGHFYYFFPYLSQLKISKITSFWVLNFIFWQNFASKKLAIVICISLFFLLGSLFFWLNMLKHVLKLISLLKGGFRLVLDSWHLFKARTQ